MELEDLAKRLEWLEKEHRKDHALIAELQQQIADYESTFTVLREQDKRLPPSCRVTRPPLAASNSSTA
jgi:uncharacterized coiled-coil protein SlyX